jgi:hypothetical protein
VKAERGTKTEDSTDNKQVAVCGDAHHYCPIAHDTAASVYRQPWCRKERTRMIHNQKDEGRRFCHHSFGKKKLEAVRQTVEVTGISLIIISQRTADSGQGKRQL